MRKRIVFLDIDGVLNTMEVMRDANRFDAMGRDQVSKLIAAFDEIDELNAGFSVEIVISSSWRHGSEASWDRRIRQAFAEADWNDPPIIGRTPTTTDVRGEEIREWLVENFGEAFDNHVQFVIIDDDVDDMLSEQYDNIVCCDGEFGFTSQNREQLMKILFDFTQDEWIDVVGHIRGFENVFVLDREASADEAEALMAQILEIKEEKERNGSG